MANALLIDEFTGTGPLADHAGNSGVSWPTGDGAGALVLNGTGQVITSGGWAWRQSNVALSGDYVVTAVMTSRETSSISHVTVRVRAPDGQEAWVLRARSNSFWGAACDFTAYNTAGQSFGSGVIEDINTSEPGTHYGEPHKYQLRVSLNATRYELIIDDVLRATVNLTGTPRTGTIGLFIEPLAANPQPNIDRLLVGQGSDLAEPVMVAIISSYVAAPSMLFGAAIFARQPHAAIISLPGVLSAGIVARHDFTGQIGDAVTLYVMDLLTPAGAVRVPISSWQATLQTGSSNYVQCVVPACAPWVGALNAATEFVIYRRAVLPGALALEYEMARAPAQQVQFDRGPQRYTCTLSGYSSAFAANVAPSATYDRALTGLRSISSGAGLRVRCAVDWLLRPGQRAFVEGAPFIVGYINYYASAGDAYMDVGEQR